MKIQTITLRGFRCFDEQPTTVRLEEGMTVFVGANGSGKTAVLEALIRVFGLTAEQRRIHRSDFYVRPGEDLKSKATRELTIDLRLGFPELAEASSDASAIPAAFSHMIVSGPGEPPHCRVRLKAVWTDDGTTDGDITQKLSWVLNDADSPADADLEELRSQDRAQIQVHYLPAVRGASSQLSYAIETLVGRLLNAAAWSQATVQSVEGTARAINDALGRESAVTALKTTLAKRWRELHDSSINAEPDLRFVKDKFDDVVRRFHITLRPAETSDERELSDLSEGQKSLFYFALAAAVFDMERKIVEVSNGSTDSARNVDFDVTRLHLPSLTIFAVEEPENHLSAHFLSRIIKQLNSIVGGQAAQAILTSHAPTMLTRIDPIQVRHFRSQAHDRTSIIREIKLPDSPPEAAKYVREAVIAFPEIYFARFVILGEGDSEQIVLPRLAKALNLDVDRAFVTIAPLGGRYTNHFWKLLADLQIPHATLLDLDLGRFRGGADRIQDVVNQLVEIGAPLDLEDEGGMQRTLQPAELRQLSDLKYGDCVQLEDWLQVLEKRGIFFSQPLDIDMSMMLAFEEAYKSTYESEHGSRAFPKQREKILQVFRVVLGDTVDGEKYADGELGKLWKPFVQYRYLFKSKGKPATHVSALSQLSDQDLSRDAPRELKRLLLYVHRIVTTGVD